MATEPKSRRRRRKKILRQNDGSLYDASERRRITTAELRDYLRDGGLFEARRLVCPVRSVLPRGCIRSA